MLPWHFVNKIITASSVISLFLCYTVVVSRGGQGIWDCPGSPGARQAAPLYESCRTSRVGIGATLPAGCHQTHLWKKTVPACEWSCIWRRASQSFDGFLPVLGWQHTGVEKYQEMGFIIANFVPFIARLNSFLDLPALEMFILPKYKIYEWHVQYCKERTQEIRQI